MKIGCIISMYDEINTVKANIDFLKSQGCPIIVIQSHPVHDHEILDASTVDHYELLPDVGGSKENYKKAMEVGAHYAKGKINTIPATALSRNFSHAFTAARNFDVDWWVVLLGDVQLTNLIGIKKIIDEMARLNRHVGITRGVGLKFPNYEGTEYNRIQWYDTTDFFPQFFLVSGKSIRNSLFNDIKLTNPYGTEITLGDNLVIYCKTNKIDFWKTCYSICDYPAPKWIEGLHYNKDRTVLPSFLLGPMNWYRRTRMQVLYKKLLPLRQDVPSEYL